MRLLTGAAARLPAVLAVTAMLLSGGLTGCSATSSAPNLQVGECLAVGGTPDRPTATVAPCGSPQANFKVVETVTDREQCPDDVDSSYSMHTAFSKSSSTACLDVDWVVGGCMSVDPEHHSDPVRVDCKDTTAPHRQRATQIIKNVANVDQCASGLGYAYQQRRFTVCVEAVS